MRISVERKDFVDAYSEFSERFATYGSALRDSNLTWISYFCSQQSDRLSGHILGAINYVREQEGHLDVMRVLIAMDDFSHLMIDERIRRLQQRIENRRNGVQLNLPFNESDVRQNPNYRLGIE